MTAGINWPNFLLLMFVICMFMTVHCIMTAIEKRLWEKRHFRQSVVKHPSENGYWWAALIFGMLTYFTVAMIGMVER